MANTKKAETEKDTKRKFDLATLVFTKDNEEEGRWVEPVIFGQKIGVEFLVLGANSDRISIVNEDFNKRRADIAKLVDPEERAKQTDALYAKSAAQRVIGLRNAPDAEITVNGKPIEYSQPMVELIFSKSPDTASFIVRFSMDSENFTDKKNA